MTVLSELRPGQHARVMGTVAERRLMRRLAELGLTSGAELSVIQATRSALILAVRGGRIALSQTIARQINVSLEPEERA